MTGQPPPGIPAAWLSPKFASHPCPPASVGSVPPLKDFGTIHTVPPSGCVAVSSGSARTQSSTGQGTAAEVLGRVRTHLCASGPDSPLIGPCRRCKPRQGREGNPFGPFVSSRRCYVRRATRKATIASAGSAQVGPDTTIKRLVLALHIEDYETKYAHDYATRWRVRSCAVVLETGRAATPGSQLARLPCQSRGLALTPAPSQPAIVSPNGDIPWKEAAVTPLRPRRPPGLPSAKALHFATEVVCRVSVLPETQLHPEIDDQVLQLAYLLTAYGLVPTEPQKRPVGSVAPRERAHGQSRSGRSHRENREGEAAPACFRTLRIRDGWARPEHVARVKQQLREAAPYIMRASMARLASTGPSPQRAPWHTHHQSEVRISGHLRRKHSGFVDRRNHYVI